MSGKILSWLMNGVRYTGTFFKIISFSFFFLRQISMSVLLIPVRVMKMLIAKTTKVLTAVRVNKDLMEMGRSAKVNKDAVSYIMERFSVDC